MVFKLLVVFYYGIVGFSLVLIFLSSLVKDRVLVRNSEARKQARVYFDQPKFYEQMHEIAKAKGFIPTVVRTLNNSNIGS